MSHLNFGCDRAYNIGFHVADALAAMTGICVVYGVTQSIFPFIPGKNPQKFLHGDLIEYDEFDENLQFNQAENKPAIATTAYGIHDNTNSDIVPAAIFAH